MSTDPAAIKACCAAAYGQDAVSLILGESYHPGGLAATRRLADALGLRPGCRVVDVACGPGATARLLATEYGATVDGVDLAGSTVDRARSAAADLAGVVRFHRGDAERLPLTGGVADAVVCECALCTFPDKDSAVAEFARVLRPGARVGITDVVVTDQGLPPALTTPAAWVACIADARTLDQYTSLLAGAGLVTRHVEEHDAALIRMIDQIEARVRLLRMTAADRLRAAGVDVDAVLRYTSGARDAVAAGLLGYRLVVAEKTP